MKIGGDPLGSSPPEACLILYNIYDCTGEQVAFYVTLASAIPAIVLVIYGLRVILYRVRHRLDLAVFHRLDGVYVPVPITSIIAVTVLFNLLRALLFIPLLFDWPPSWLARGLLNGCMFSAGIAGAQLFTLGVVAHIPPIFSQSNSQDTTAGRSFVYVPSPRTIYWINLLSSVLMAGTCFASCVWYGWIRERGTLGIQPLHHQRQQQRQQRHSLRLLMVPLVVWLMVQFLGCVYYSIGFYRIITEHAAQSAAYGRATEGMLKAAHRFRTIFLMVAGACISSAILCVLLIALADITYDHDWVSHLILGLCHAVMLPLFEAGIMHTVLESSVAFSKRDTQLSMQSDVTPRSVWHTVGPCCHHHRATNGAKWLSGHRQAMAGHTHATATLTSQPDEAVTEKEQRSVNYDPSGGSSARLISSVETLRNEYGRLVEEAQPATTAFHFQPHCRHHHRCSDPECDSIHEMVHWPET